MRLHRGQTLRWPSRVPRSTPSELHLDQASAASADSQQHQQQVRQQHQHQQLQQHNNNLQQVWEEQSSVASADIQHQQQHQRQQQQEDKNLKQVWEEQGIEAWAAITARELLQRLRDEGGDPLALKYETAMQRDLVIHLGKRCSTQAGFLKRCRIATSAEQLLQCALHLGFDGRQIRKLVDISSGKSFVKPKQLLAHVEWLRRMNGGSKHKAIVTLPQNWRLLRHRLDSLSDKFQSMQQISGASPAQAATMIGKTACFLTLSNGTMSATVEGLLGALHNPSKSPLLMSLIWTYICGAERAVYLCTCKVRVILVLADLQGSATRTARLAGSSRVRL